MTAQATSWLSFNLHDVAFGGVATDAAVAYVAPHIPWMTYLARQGSDVVLKVSVPSSVARNVTRHRVWRVFAGTHVVSGGA